MSTERPPRKTLAERMEAKAEIKKARTLLEAYETAKASRKQLYIEPIPFPVYKWCFIRGILHPPIEDLGVMERSKLMHLIANREELLQRMDRKMIRQRWLILLALVVGTVVGYLAG